MHINTLIIYPMLAMVALTFVIWLWMYYTRVMPVLKGELSIDDYGKADMKYPARLHYATDNFSNLFEMPSLFYLLCTLLLITQSVTDGLLYMAWAYVGLRLLHSLIHCSVNNILYRFISYQISSWILWGMWLVFVWEWGLNRVLHI